MLVNIKKEIQWILNLRIVSCCFLIYLLFLILRMATRVTEPLQENQIWGTNLKLKEKNQFLKLH